MIQHVCACRVCGVSAEVGRPLPDHAPQVGSRSGLCPGSGQWPEVIAAELYRAPLYQRTHEARVLGERKRLRRLLRGRVSSVVEDVSRHRLELLEIELRTLARRAA